MKNLLRTGVTFLWGGVTLFSLIFFNFVFADDEVVAKIWTVEYTSLQEALDASNGVTVSLEQDISGNFTVTGMAVLDLNWKTISSNTTGVDTIVITSWWNLIIQWDGTITCNLWWGACVFNNGTTVLSWGTIKKDNKLYYNITNHGVMTINTWVVVENIVAYVNWESHASLVENGYYDYNVNNSRNWYVASVNHSKPTLIINGWIFNWWLNTIKNDDGASLIINDAMVYNNIQVAVFNVNEAVINSGYFDVPQWLEKQPYIIGG